MEPVLKTPAKSASSAVTSRSGGVSVFDYDDFRAYLKDWFRSRKNADPSFSYRRLATLAGFKSAGHFTLILNGTASLSRKMLQGFISVTGLAPSEAEYFETLVNYAQAADDRDKIRCFDRLHAISPNRLRSLKSDEFEFYRQWYYAAVRDVLSFYPFKGDYAGLAKAIDPPITAWQAKQAVALLERLNMLHQSGAAWVLADRGLSAHTKDSSKPLTQYASAMLDMSKRALETMPKEDRAISWVSFSTSQNSFDKIQEEMRAFRKRVLDIVAQDDAPDRACHLNMQLFPVSKIGAFTRRGKR